MTKVSGIELCEMALERLLNNEPHVSVHVGVKASEITPSMVSVEAGFDKGYLKKSRGVHKTLIAKINALKANESNSSNSKSKLIKLEKENRTLREEKLESDKIKEQVLTQNLILLQAVRDLESKLLKMTNVTNIR